MSESVTAAEPASDLGVAAHDLSTAGKLATAAHAPLRRSLEDRLLLEVARKSGRSYVGWVVRNTADVNWSGDVSRLPMFSGCRDNDTRSFAF